MFFGLSTADCVTADMVRLMAAEPGHLRHRQPRSRNTLQLAITTRPDAIVATGRSDYPNQVNNVLGFPFIFRGALDVRATTINEEMKLAATKALAALAKEDVPDSVLRAYGLDRPEIARLEFGPHYLIPKPFDPRVLVWEAAAVAEAAMQTGVARITLDIAAYREQLERRLGRAREVMRVMVNKAQVNPKRIVFPEGEETKILRASQILIDEKIAEPILIGREAVIRARMAELDITCAIRIVDPSTLPGRAGYAQELYELRQRKGVTLRDADELLLNHTVFASLMLRRGEADALIGGLTQHYPEVIRPALQVISVRPGLKNVCGVYVVITQKGEIYFLADATVNIEPTEEDLAEIALCAAEVARRFGQEPRVALLSFSNFGSSNHPLATKVARAVALVRKRDPGLMVDGEMQADTAVVPEIIQQDYPFSTLKGGANVLVFPNLEAGNVAYKLLARIGGAEAIGPILIGLSKPVHVLQRGAEVNDVVNIAAIAVVEAQDRG